MTRRILFLWQGGYPSEIRIDKMIATFRADGYEVAILCRQVDARPAKEIRDGLHIVRVGRPPRASRSPMAARLTKEASLPVWFNPLWSAALDRLLSEFSPDVLVVRDLPLALLAAKARRRPGLVVVLDMAEHYPEAMRSWRKYTDRWLSRTLVNSRLPDWIEQRAVSGMDGVVVVCEEQKRRLERELDISGHRVAVVLNTPDLAIYEGVKRGAANDPPRVFGYHGNLCNDRDLGVVLRGFDIAVREDDSLRLLICGDGESAQELRAIAKALPASDKIEFTGRYAPADLGELYARTDFGIVSLLENKFTQNTLANKFFDYAGLGKPFVYTRLAPLENVMRDIRCGEPFEAGDPHSVARAMLRLRDADYHALSRNGRAGVENRFNWGGDARVLLDFVSRLAEAKRSRAAIRPGRVVRRNAPHGIKQR